MAEGFETIARIAAMMKSFPAPWFVSGGWAIDLWVGRVTRTHSDAEIGLYRADQETLRRHYSAGRLEKCIPTGGAAGRWTVWERSELLDPPIHQARVLSPNSMVPAVEFLLNEQRNGFWSFRRHPELLRPLDAVWTTSFLGIPILLPEIQLLFKAKLPRPKDQHDFEQALPHMTSVQRAWLKEALLKCHPDHSWLVRLSDQD